MKIGIISDIHDRADYLVRALDIIKENNCELIICCGDWGSASMPRYCANIGIKIVSVFGNNDADIYQFLTRKQQNQWNIDFFKIVAELNLDGQKAIAYHGESTEILEALIDCQKYDLVFSGHDHNPIIKEIDKTIHINPGSIATLHDGQFGGESTIAIYDTSSKQGEIIKLNAMA